MSLDESPDAVAAEVPRIRFRDAPVTAVTALLAVAVSVWWWSGGEVSRLLTPGTNPTAVMLLFVPWTCVVSVLPHLDLVHLVFNLYWLWALGAVIETRCGSRRTLGIFLLCAMVSSSAEFAFGGLGFGLSGVVYGLFGILLVRGQTDETLKLSRGTIQLFVFWFFLCIALTMLQVWNIANVAHGAGALAGMLVAWSMDAATARRRLAGSTLAIGAAGVATASLLGFFGFGISGGPAEVWALCGDAAFDNDERAARFYGEAVKLDPSEPDLWYNLGILRERLAEYDEAVDAYRQAYELDPDDASAAAAWKEALSLQAWDAGNIAEAIRLQSESVHIDNTEPYGWYLLALYYEEDDQLYPAIEAVKRALDLAPDDDDYRELLASLQEAVTPIGRK